MTDAPRTFDIHRPDIVDVALPMTGERQVASKIEGIAPDHVKRYEWAAEFLANLQDEKGSPLNVLDAGCGCGYGSAILAKEGFNITAMDVSPDAITFAKTVWAAPNIDHVVDNVETLDYENLRFDAIVCFECLEHVEATIATSYFPSIAPVLLTSVPNEDTMPWTRESHPYHLRHYTPAEFESLLWEYEIVDRMTQKTKRPGIMEDGFDGRTLIVAARVVK